MEKHDISLKAYPPAHQIKKALFFGRDKALKEMISQLLQEMGLTCYSFYEHKQGDISKKLHPAFAIIDCTMRGDEMQSYVLNLDQVPVIPIIFLSSYSLSELDFHPEHHHVFLDKPFCLKDFVHSVKALLSLSEKQNKLQKH